MKPIVFFSQSSLDKDRILPIKNHIKKKTGNAINIFMSSDGASISFGKNWVKEIEDALKNCKLMFVWVTPNSTQSNWIYFESGYAYSRKIKVVPIGFDGIKLEELPPPLSLLQGFNINSSASLNNIMAILNQEFNLTFPDIFDDTFYKKNISGYFTENSAELLEFVNGIKSTLHQQIQINDNDHVIIARNWLESFQKVLKKRNEFFTLIKDKELFGLGFKLYLQGPTISSTSQYPEIFIDPLALNNSWDILTELNRCAYNNKFKNIILNINLNPTFTLPDDNFTISSRLLNTEVSFETERPCILYKFRNVLFRINIFPGRMGIVKELIIIVDQDNTDSIPILSLVRLLVKQNIITEVIS